MQTTSLNWPVRYMYRIRHRIIKPVLITEEGGEKTCVLSFDGYGSVYMQRHTRAKSQKQACHVPAGIKLALSCTVHNHTNNTTNNVASPHLMLVAGKF